MGKITAKDIESFGKVLEKISQYIQHNPENVLAIITKSTDSVGKEQITTNRPFDTLKANGFQLFEAAKSLDEDLLAKRLSDFSVEELKYILKVYHLGGTKLKSREKIIHHITEQAMKRTVDVFLKNESIF